MVDFKNRASQALSATAGIDFRLGLAGLGQGKGCGWSIRKGKNLVSIVRPTASR